MNKTEKISCLKCDKPNFIEKLATFKIDNDPENIYEVQSLTFECQACKFQVMNNKQMDDFRNLIKEHEQSKVVSK